MASIGSQGISTSSLTHYTQDFCHRELMVLKLQWEKHHKGLKVSGLSTEIADSYCATKEMRKRRRKGENRVEGRRRDSKPSVPLAILMSSAVRIKAMRVELKWTVLSSATGRSMRSSL